MEISVEDRLGKQGSAIRGEDESMLPNFCSVQSIIVTLLIAELGAITLSVMRSSHHPAPFYDFIFLSLLMSGAVLIWAASLCSLRRRIETWSEVKVFACGISLSVVVGLIGGGLWYFIANMYPDFTHSAHVSWAGHVYRGVLLSSVIGFVVLYYLRVHYHIQKHARAMLEARTQALQARIRPHFLFNTLNTIAELTSINPKDAERAVYDLARLYRTTLSDVRKLTTLEDELDTCRAYVSIEQYRMGSRLKVEWEIDDALSKRSSLPSLTLQPLVENAMYHGIEPRPDGGVVKIKAFLLRDGRVEVSVTNPLPGRERSNRHKGNNIALDNIRQRFALIFGPSAELVTEKVGDEFYAAIRFPHQI